MFSFGNYTNIMYARQQTINKILKQMLIVFVYEFYNLVDIIVFLRQRKAWEVIKLRSFCYFLSYISNIRENFAMICVNK